MKRGPARDAYELLSSMRFAVSLLTVLAVASIIGTVLKQAEPYPNYVEQFGQFWFPVFETLGLYDVYHAGWFLLILVFLVASTSLCIYRNGPLMLREMKSYREHATESSLRHFAHRVEFDCTAERDTLPARLTQYLAVHRFRCRVRPVGEGGRDMLIAAKAGSYHRLGYILTHSAIVIICIGGLLDGNMPLKFLQLTGQKVIETRDIPQSRVPPQSRLASSSLSFRGSVTIPEGTSADVVFMNVGEGYLVQELPFTIALKKFYIEHYSTGQPKDFASDLVIFDKQTRRSFERTVRVNHPLIYKGVAIYQASFADGGTRMRFTGWPLFGGKEASFPFAGAVNKSTRLVNDDTQYTVEFTDFRPFNVENLADNTASRAEVAGVTRKILERLGSAAADDSRRDLRNVGPSFQYKLRDAQGQAREFNNYMLPLQFNGRWYLLTGMRANPNDPFRYMRLPLDAQGRIDGYMRLRAALFDASLRPEIARRFAQHAASGDAVSATMREKLAESAERVMELFARGGFEAVANFLQKSVSEADQGKAVEVYLKVLEGTAIEALQLARGRAGLPPSPADNDTLRFVHDSLNAASDSFLFGSPVYLQLTQYEEVKASGLQLTRSPGKNIVYAGALLLVLGVFAMFYIRERRIWLLVKPAAGRILFAMSGNRHTLEFEREFESHRRAIAALTKD